jgi:hypothetical protein
VAQKRRQESHPTAQQPSKERPIVSVAFDPYHRWLGISPKDQPPNHYRLLAIDRFESDAEVIRDAVERQMAHVRTYQLGEYSELSQRILNELAAAKACLLDPAEKAAYDRRLRAQSENGDRQPLPERPVRGFAQTAPVPFSASKPPPPPAPRQTVGAIPALSVEQALDGSPAWTHLTQGGPIRRTLRRIDAMLLSAVGEENVFLHRFVRVLAVALPLALVLGICLPLYHFAVGTGSESLAVRGSRTPIAGVSLPPDSETKGQSKRPPPPPPPLAAPPPPLAPPPSPMRPDADRPARRLCLLPVPKQAVIAGHKLSVQIQPEEPGLWRGDLRYSLLPDAPDGATIDPIKGVVDWTVPSDETRPLVAFRVAAEGPEGQRVETEVRVGVTPRTLQLQRIAPRDVVPGQLLTLRAQVDAPESWDGELRFSLEGGAPAGATIDPQTGFLTWSVPRNELHRVFNFFVAVDGPAGQRKETPVNIRVVRPKNAPANPPKGHDRPKGPEPAPTIPDDVRPLIGKWTVRKTPTRRGPSVGPWVWSFYEDGTATGGYKETRTGPTRGTWTINRIGNGKKEVKIVWSKDYWATFHFPIDPKDTRGDSWDGNDLIHARRTSSKPPQRPSR